MPGRADRWLPTLAQPPLERTVGHVGSVDVAHPEGVDDAALGVEHADGPARADVDRVASDVEGVRVEAAPPHGGLCLPGPRSTGDGDIDLGRDVVDQVMAGQCRAQAQRCQRSPRGDLDQVVIAEPFGLAVQPREMATILPSPTNRRN